MADMGSLETSADKEDADFDYDDEQDEDVEETKTGEEWPRGFGADTWQSMATTTSQRVRNLHNNREMSDLGVLACDENWWFGETVKDFTAHKLILGSASPVFHKILFEMEEDEKCLLLDKCFGGITLSLVPCFGYVRLDLDGVPPIAAEALLDYVYRDHFNESDYENGYSRNLLWRLWQAAQAFEMEHLASLCERTLHKTMCEDTVFWDLNYAMQYKDMGTGEIRAKALALSDEMHERLYENPNFVWLDFKAVQELLQRRNVGSCDALVIYNNLLRWTLYQLDRTAVAEVDEMTGAEIPIVHRLEWIAGIRNRTLDHVTVKELDKYLRRGLELMPWTELSQKEFLEFVAPYSVLEEAELLKQAVAIMEVVVRTPSRLLKSAFRYKHGTPVLSRRGSLAQSAPNSPGTPRKKPLSRTNSLRKSITEVKLRRVMKDNNNNNNGTPTNSRPHSYIAAWMRSTP